MIEEGGNDAKKMYRVVNCLTNGDGEVILPEGEEDKVVANKFTDFFKSKIVTIRDHLENFPLYDPTADFSKGKKLSRFTEVTVEEVEGLVRKSKATSCILHPIPSSIVKRHFKVLAPLVTRIINFSMSRACFLGPWKIATITPLQKKVWSNVELSNYHPVNTLPYISKTAEKAMMLQFSKYIEDKLPEYISAYRDGFSTEMVLLWITDDILMSLDSQRIISMVCTDLSAAFDTVDIEVMLTVLEKSYGVQDMVLTWCKIYLTKRQARVKIKHELSEKSDINFSVPQGSVLGPILFNLYVSTLSYETRDLPL